MRKLPLLSAAGAALLALLAVPDVAAAQPGDEGARWRDVATDHDRGRIRGWRTAWMEALGQARRGHGTEIERAGALMEPDAALPRPAPPTGAYRCRTIKLGARARSNLTWIAYPWFDCRIGGEGGVMTFTRSGGSQRAIGHLYPGGPRRMIFLGSLQLGDEQRVLRYGSDPVRDMAGILERVGERQWRLVFPRPTFESIVDVIELVPA